MLSTTKANEILIVILLSAIWSRAGAGTNSPEQKWAATAPATLTRDELVCSVNPILTALRSDFYVEMNNAMRVMDVNMTAT